MAFVFGRGGSLALFRRGGFDGAKENVFGGSFLGLGGILAGGGVGEVGGRGGRGLSFASWEGLVCRHAEAKNDVCYWLWLVKRR